MPTYAIDNKMFYPDEWQYWGTNSLAQEFSMIHRIGVEHSDINTPFLNFGMQFTSFGIHHEDSNLTSMDIVHGGEPKTWYVVPSSNAVKLEQLFNRHS